MLHPINHLNKWWLENFLYFLYFRLRMCLLISSHSDVVYIQPHLTICLVRCRTSIGQRLENLQQNEAHLFPAALEAEIKLLVEDQVCFCSHNANRVRCDGCLGAWVTLACKYRTWHPQHLDSNKSQAVWSMKDEEQCHFTLSAMCIWKNYHLFGGTDIEDGYRGRK